MGIFINFAGGTVGALAGLWFKHGESSPLSIQHMISALKLSQDDHTQSFSFNQLLAGYVHQQSRIESDYTWQDDRLFLSYIGDIRNTKELRQQAAAPATAGTAEILARLYDKLNNRMALRINGVFAILIHHKRNNTTTLINDRLGQIRLYYTQKNGNILFASKAKALLAFDDSRYSINRDMLLDLFLYRSPMSYESLFRGIHVMPPATIWRFSEFDNNQTTYWNLEDQIASPHKMADKDILENSRQLFNKAVEQTLDADVTFSFGLTSGLDSRCILSAIQPNGKSIDCFTRGGENNPDVLIAQKLAEEFDFPHERKKVVQVDAHQFEEKLRKAVYFTEGLGNMESAAYLDSVTEARTASTTLRQLTGTLGNQTMRIPLFFANKPYAYAKTEDAFLGKLPFGHRALTSLFDSAFSQIVKIYIGISDPAKFFKPEFLKLARDRFHHINTTNYGTADRVGYKSLSGKLHYIALKHLIQNCFPARNPMGEIYYRSPFIDSDFFEHMAKVPLSYKSELKTPVHRYIIKTNNPVLAEIPFYSKANIAYFTKTSEEKWRGVFKPDIPKTILFELGHRMRTDLKEFTTKILLRGDNWCFQFLDKNYITHLVQNHLDGKINATYIISNLICFELWYEQFAGSLHGDV
jgi:hypothetical protein